ncbi:Crp/Fnr family transcriptional regulator [Leptospira kanakyensis]|uniref:Cyclic nucleotide-binding domain-containing protein n=1 Tax=Leptospira kanakyensis TaxID=2484968 RepID=A0A6N4Q4K9_9LEPT|nr:cyclic nucleotide-binding domain-containing protein [Leptospira kanakyensis]MCW7470446.1 cyclic nucleotide-binding domain-containing protein [Leptospira kanakyensis]MCW7481536.1 cyclic nucleotide-binding domain-containing protein [Leptospira kanakyensis]TGK53923.1 cyclic nucleotide-binding domain-containing protein [Leptospira kanakyensis]TGK57717.1 cyclic nucleotide-binding domain-containing protein [Leptospira kanakyensis]TGK73427.1 cyclic nucleotide-binding domain-containing protein [Lep
MNVEHLRKYITEVRIDHFSPGTKVFSEGEDSNGKMFFVFAGGLQVFKRKASGEDQYVRDIGPGEFFGEMALVYPSPRAATVVASAEDTKVGIITKEIFFAMGKESPGFLSVILHSIIGRLTAVEDSISERQRELHTLINGMPSLQTDPISTESVTVSEEKTQDSEEPKKED